MLRIAIAFVLLCACLNAQTSVFDRDFRKDWETSRQFTLAVAEAMPADKYGFKVTNEEMAFGALMIHIATSNAFRFAQIAGKQMPLHVPGTIPKEEAKEMAKKLLMESFDFCLAQLDQFTPAQMEKVYQVGWYERPDVTGRQLILGMFVHTAHHRGQAEVYLRANGIKPPVYRF